MGVMTVAQTEKPTKTHDGVGHSHYPIPWSALKYDTALQGYRTGITEAQLKNAPDFSDDSWTDRDWETRTHQHYGAPVYWGA